MIPEAKTLDDIHDQLIDVGKQQLRERLPWVVTHLDHPTDFVRAAALRAVAFYWRLPDFRAMARARLTDDPSPEVRAVAASCLGGYGYLAYSAEEMTALVSKAIDPNEDDSVRAAAFSGALVASHVPRHDYPMARALPDFEARAPWGLLVEALARVDLAVPPRLRSLAEARHGA